MAPNSLMARAMPDAVADFWRARAEVALAAGGAAVEVVDLAGMPSLEGRHNRQNAAAAYAVLGREKEARTEVSEILRIEPNFSIKKYAGFMYFQVDLEREIEGLRKAGLPE